MKRLWTKIKALPKKKQILLALFSSLVIVGIIFLIWSIITGRIKPFAADENQVINTATVTWDGGSALSNTIITQIQPSDAQAPTVPTSVQGSAISSTEIDLTWASSTDDAGVTGYNIYRNGSKLSNPSTTNSFKDTGLQPATAYFYEITAFDAANNESGRSSPPTQVTTLLQDQNIMINIAYTLQGRTSLTDPNYSASNISLKVYLSGQTTSVFEITNLNADNSGHGQVAATGLTTGNSYDFKTKVPGYLTLSKTNIVAENSFTVDFGMLKAGDIYADNNINVSDFVLMKGKWQQPDAIADYNQDGKVNLPDFVIMKANWGINGD